MINKSDCPFCFLSDSSEILLKNSAFIVKYDNYPVAAGHVLIITKRHVLTFLELNKSEVLRFFELLKGAQKTLLLKYSPDGFTIGINQGGSWSDYRTSPYPPHSKIFW